MTMSDNHSDTPPRPPQEPPRKRRKWVQVVFVVSLTLNLLVFGLVVGAKVSDGRDHGFDPRGPDRGMIRDLGLGPIASSLSKQDRRAIGRALRAQQGSFLDKRAALKRDFNKMLEVLRSESYSRVELVGLMDAQRDRALKFGDTARGLVMDRIDQMSLEERQELADELERNVRFGRKKFPSKSHKGDDCDDH